MSGPIVLLGGDELTPAYTDLDAALLAETGASTVHLVPTAAAYERPERTIERAREHFGVLGAEVEVVPSLDRRATTDPANAERLADASLILLLDGSAMHAEATLKRSAVWDALVAAHERGAVIVAVGDAGRVLCDPMVDPRGGGFAAGLGMIRGLAFVPAADQWSADRAHRTRRMTPTGVELVAVPRGEYVRVETDPEGRPRLVT